MCGRFILNCHWVCSDRRKLLWVFFLATENDMCRQQTFSYNLNVLVQICLVFFYNLVIVKLWSDQKMVIWNKVGIVLTQILKLFDSYLKTTAIRQEPRIWKIKIAKMLKLNIKLRYSNVVKCSTVMKLQTTEDYRYRHISTSKLEHGVSSYSTNIADLKIRIQSIDHDISSIKSVYRGTPR